MIYFKFLLLLWLVFLCLFTALLSQKKYLHDQHMIVTRLDEEKHLLVVEMAQHCSWLNEVGKLQRQLAQEGKFEQVFTTFGQHIIFSKNVQCRTS